MKVKHDFHIHTHLSLCASDKTGTVENYLESAKKQGLNKLGFADHFWGSEPGDPEYYNNVRMNPSGYYLTQNYDYISQIKPQLEKFKNDDVKFYFGAECEYDPFKKSIAVSKGQVETFDFLIVPNSHTHMMMPKSLYEPYQKHVDFMFDAFYDIINCEFSKYVTSIAHPFHGVCTPYDINELFKLIPNDRYKKAFDAAANKNIAIEINVAAIAKESPDEWRTFEEELRMYNVAKECGCKFTFGSDAHIISEHINYSSCDEIANILGLTENDIAEIAR